MQVPSRMTDSADPSSGPPSASSDNYNTNTNTDHSSSGFSAKATGAGVRRSVADKYNSRSEIDLLVM
jgi:hypothetical protein